MRWFVILTPVFFLFGCNSTKNAGDRSKDKPLVEQELRLERKPGENRIAFLTLAVWLKDSVKDEYGFDRKTIIYAEGRIKKQAAFMGQYENYELYWEIRDAKKNLAAVGKVPDPLYRSFETSEEHSGKMERHLLRSATGEIVIRFNLDDEAKLLSVYKLSNNKLKKLYEASIL